MSAAVLARRIARGSAVAILSLGCASPAARLRPDAVVTDTTFYVSARARLAGRDTRRLADSLEYGLFVTTRRPAEDPQTDRELPFRPVDSTRLSRDAFVGALRSRAATGAFAVLYTHGFGTDLHEAWEQAVHGRLRSQGTEPWVVFCWPASGGWLTWPKNGSVLATSYRQDSASAVASRDAFLEAFGAAREAVGSERLVLFSHSLGVQVVGEALARPAAPRAILANAPLRAIAFYAADVEAHRFTEVLVPALRPLTQRLVLYASSDDRALALAQAISRTQRAGRIARTGGLPVLAPGLESVDVTTGESAEGFFRRLFGARHGVRHANAALFDLMQLVGPARAPACRESLGLAERTAPTAWRLRPVALPALDAAKRCAPASP